ncbi:hypothetical protein IM697_28600 [Streptomyces ferrugineus]|uniref:Xaa-Pro dipeptidyl-peptidase C-terminal domain-containing protein n=1 Tax=Streptomyces ferrugineus TaxID=1413221 RepID=A0A7M2SCS4_9ACTN|nr:hypothetical protein IM697_28600 [Streptomyces ferrugineus]
MYRPRMPKRTRFTIWRPLATAAVAALPARFPTPAAAHAAPRESKPRKAKTADVDYTVVSRGRAGLGNHAPDPKGGPLTPGKPYTATPDHVVPAGHRLALIVAGTGKDLIEPPSAKPTLALVLARTKARVPLVGRAHAFPRATADAPSAAPVAGRLDGVPTAPRPVHRIPEAGQ